MESLESILRGGFEDYRDFVNPQIHARADVAREPIRFVRAEGGRVVTDDGRVLEDFHGTQAFGHRHPKIAEAITTFLASDAPNWFPTRVNPFAGRLARRLCERAGHYQRVYFACSGSDGVEAALKLARASTRRPRILGLERGYHGCTFGSLSIMHEGPFKEPFGPHLPGAEHLPWDEGVPDELLVAFVRGGHARPGRALDEQLLRRVRELHAHAREAADDREHDPLLDVHELAVVGAQHVVDALVVQR